MATLPFAMVDAFTDRPFHGNPAVKALVLSPTATDVGAGHPEAPFGVFGRSA